jgi:hypothetical protein
MQEHINKTVNEIRKEDLQTVTGGCATCVGLGSIALGEAERASTIARHNLGNNNSTASKELKRAQRLQQIARVGLNNANKPALEGCHHCENVKKLTTTIARYTRNT